MKNVHYSHKWENKLKKRGIYTRCCDNFSGLDERYIRIALRSREDNEMLLKAIRGIVYG